MKTMVEEETTEIQGRRWIWRFAVAVCLEAVVGLLCRWRWSVFVLRVKAMFWISCGISVVPVSVVVAAGGVDGDDEVVSDLPLLLSSPISARASAMQRETVSMVIPTVY